MGMLQRAIRAVGIGRSRKARKVEVVIVAGQPQGSIISKHTRRRKKGKA